MITNIKIENAASYKEKVEITPKKVNFLFGGNGTGKTTISRLLNNPNQYNYSTIEQDENDEILVYNNDFVNLHFSDNSLIKGIFTLGKDSNEILEKIKKLEETQNEITDELKSKKLKLEKQKGELEQARVTFNDNCWRYKQEYNSYFGKLFVGRVGTKDLFAKYCLSISPTGTEKKTKEELKKTYDSLYVNKLTSIPKIDKIIKIDFSDLPGMIALNESISSNKTLQMSILIDKLKNSDWVKKGVEYLSDTKNICPFCQQEINDEKLSMINNLFNESYEITIKRIKEAKEQYSTRVKNVISSIKSIVYSYQAYFDVEELNNNVANLENVLLNNNLIFEKKIDNPSIKFSLAPLDEIILKINTSIAQLNTKIDENNNKVKNIDNEKQQLLENVNNSLYSELKDIIIAFKKNEKGLKTGIDNIQSAIDRLENDKKSNKLESSNLRASMSGIANTLEKMNKLLASFGFNDFTFVANDNSTYKVVRTDGTNVGNTLSEGEQRFITFIYFYQLVQGTLEESGIKGNRVIVIDDPISSLDSNILFIVSTLVKNIIDDCLKSINNVKQVFILTHNIYFFKEITFRPNRAKFPFTQDNTDYFIIKKNDGTSDIKEYKKNPISTTYDLLWDEIRNNQEKNKGTIFNTMRRILEYYFNTIGGLEYEKIINNFEGEEQQLCHSLLSCINDNSHYIPDDYSIVITDEMIQKYVEIFRLVFEKTGHISHYKMMMKLND